MLPPPFERFKRWGNPAKTNKSHIELPKPTLRERMFARIEETFFRGDLYLPVGEALRREGMYYMKTSREPRTIETEEAITIHAPSLIYDLDPSAQPTISYEVARLRRDDLTFVEGAHYRGTLQGIPDRASRNFVDLKNKHKQAIEDDIATGQARTRQLIAEMLGSNEELLLVNGAYPYTGISLDLVHYSGSLTITFARPELGGTIGLYNNTRVGLGDDGQFEVSRDMRSPKVSLAPACVNFRPLVEFLTEPLR